MVCPNYHCISVPLLWHVCGELIKLISKNVINFVSIVTTLYIVAREMKSFEVRVGTGGAIAVGTGFHFTSNPLCRSVSEDPDKLKRMPCLKGRQCNIHTLSGTAQVPSCMWHWSVLNTHQQFPKFLWSFTFLYFQIFLILWHTLQRVTLLISKCNIV